MKLDYSRSTELWKFPRVGTGCVVYGIGTVGSYLAVPLSKIPWNGGKRGELGLVFVDFDTVEAGNIAYQNYVEQDIGREKTKAAEIFLTNDACSIDFIDGRAEDHVKDLVQRMPRSIHIGCVDNLLVKAAIVLELDDCSVWIDARAGGVQVQAESFLIENADTRQQIAATLTEEQARVNAPPCGYRNVLENGSWSAGMVMTLIRHWFDTGQTGKIFLNHESCEFAYMPNVHFKNPGQSLKGVKR